MIVTSEFTTTVAGNHTLKTEIKDINSNILATFNHGTVNMSVGQVYTYTSTYNYVNDGNSLYLLALLTKTRVSDSNVTTSGGRIFPAQLQYPSDVVTLPSERVRTILVEKLVTRN